MNTLIRAGLTALAIFSSLAGPPVAHAQDGIPPALREWQADSDLAGLRDPAALALLAAEERSASAQLWAEVAMLLEKAQAAETDTRPR